MTIITDALDFLFTRHLLGVMLTLSLVNIIDLDFVIINIKLYD